MKPLNYNDYTTTNAIWLQMMIEKKKPNGTNVKQYKILCYMEYLYICNYENNELEKNVEYLLRRMNTYGFGGRGEVYLFDNDMYEDSDNIMNTITKLL